MNEYFDFRKKKHDGGEGEAELEVALHDPDADKQGENKGGDAGQGAKVEENKADKGKGGERGTARDSKGRPSSKKKTARTKEARAKIRMTEQERREYELLRRWQVKIMNIKVQNTQNEPLNCFLHFIVGGDFREEQVKSTTGKTEMKVLGEHGPNFKTECLKNIEKDEWRSVTAKFESEYRGSYLMLEDENLTIEVWENKNWTINEFIGSFEVPLGNLADGNLNRIDEVAKISKDGQLKGFMRISYTVFFQEIWDWNITFTDWKCLDLKDPNGEDIHPRLDLQMLSSGSPSLSTESYKFYDENPHWENIKGSMYFRGTIDELENQQLKIDILNTKGAFNHRFATRVVNMKGIVDFGKIKTFINMGPAKTLKKNGEDEEKKLEEKTSTVGGGQNAMQFLGIKPDQDDSVLENNAIIVQIEGRINCGVIPKYRQRGEVAELRSDKHYVLINLLKVEKIQAPEHVATVNTFVTIEWGGQTKRTATIYDSYQPVYNQLFAFKIPVKKGLEKDKKALIKFLKSELEPNNYVVFDLWLEGEGGGNDNLGSYTFPLAELQNANREERTYRDSKTKKNIKYISKVLEVNRKLVSGEDESGTGQILFEIWFLPDLEEINLAEFSKIKGDRIPPELSSTSEEQRSKEWIEGISKSFEKTPSKVRLRNFNTVYVKDQYAKRHLISMYLSKFTMNKYDVDKEGVEPEDLDFLEMDRRVSTLAEIAHFVRCIPFSSDRNSEIWNSPNSVTIMKKGNPLDHALLMACLFMACKTETNEDIERLQKEKEAKKFDLTKGLLKKDEPTEPKKLDLDLRTFVCVGTHKLTKTTCFWVMTLDADLTGVTMWETTYNKKYHLPGRITEPDRLRAYLLNKAESAEATVKKGAFAGLGKLSIGSFLKKTGDEEDEEEKDGKKDNKKKKKGKKVAINENVPEDDGEELQIAESNDADVFAVRQIKRETLGQEKKSVRFTGRGFLDELRKEFADSDEKKRATTSDSKEGERKSKFLEREAENARMEEQKDTFKRTRAVQEFKEPSGLTAKKVFVPYASLELIFNNQNIWANLQHQDPASIYYNLFDSSWKPFLMHKLPSGEEVAWRKKLGIFYNFNNIKPPMNDRELKKLKVEIIKAVNFGIENARSGFNLTTRWKHPNDRVVKHLVKYLRFLEYRDTERWDDSKLKEETAIWEKELRKMMPKNGRYAALPMFFTYSEPERIKSVVVKDAAGFFKTAEKNTIFAIGCKIFPYPGGFNSVRIILAYFCPIPEEELDEEDEEESRRESDIDIELGEGEENKLLFQNPENEAEI